MRTRLRVDRRISLIGGFLILCFSLTTVVVINYWVAGLRTKDQNLPEYGTWTGIATLEHKLQLYQIFANQGPIDAVIIGASISDHGLSAEILSKDLSAAYNRSFRVFNMSTGAAEIPTLLLIYRLIGVVAKPKQIWIAHPVEQNIGDDISDKSPDYAIIHAPAGKALRYPLFLPLSFQLYRIPLVRHAAALRDLAFHGSFVNRPGSLLDTYEINSYGDTRGFLYYSGTEPLKKYADLRRELILSLARQYEVALGEKNKTTTYFSRSNLHALAQIKSLAARDNCSIKILAVDSVAGYTSQDEDYLTASKVFYRLLSRFLDAPLVDVRASFSLASYKWADPSHLNSNGADELSRLMAARIADRPLPQLPDYTTTPEIREGRPVSKMTPFTAVVLQCSSDPNAELQLRYKQGPGVPPLKPGRRLQIMMLLPDNNIVAIPVTVVSQGHVQVATSTLPPLTENRVLFIQITSIGAKWGSGMNQPLASYQWSSHVHPQEDIEGMVKIYTEKNSYKPLEPITVYWTGVSDPTSKDWIGIFPFGEDDRARISMQWTGGHSSGTLQLPTNLFFKDGLYEARLYENGSWNLITSSKPFAIKSFPVSLEVAPKEVQRGRHIRGFWRNMEYASKDDWIGLFPQGGPDSSRLDFEFTGGKTEGDIELSVPVHAPLGPYEIRFYAAGSWNRLATSAPFRVVDSKIE